MKGFVVSFDQLDHEWLELMINAKKLGLTVEQVRSFLLQPYNPDTPQPPNLQVKSS